MKKAILPLTSILTALFLSAFAMAQSPVSEIELPTTPHNQTGFIAKGFKAGIVAASYEMKMKTTLELGGSTYTAEDKADGRYGFAGLMIGYEHLRMNSIGFNADLTLMKHSDKENHQEAAYLIASVNMNYGFTKPFSIYGGLNLSRATQGFTMKNSDGGEVQPMGLGLQLGGAYNFTKNIQWNLGYQLLSQKAEYQDDGKKIGEVEFTESSFVSGLSYIF